MLKQWDFWKQGQDPDWYSARELRTYSGWTRDPKSLFKFWGEGKGPPGPPCYPSHSHAPLTLRKAEEGKVAKAVGTVAPGRCDTVSLRTSS